jgi:SAM-dependent methyltransferase
MSGDWGELVTKHPELVQSLTVICPHLNKGVPEHLDAFPVPVLVISGDQGKPAERARSVAESFANGRLLTLEHYFSPMWADVIADRAEVIGGALLDFLARGDRGQGATALALPELDGEVEGIFYRIRGRGPALLVLPLSLAPSQWDPLLPRLSRHYCVITLGGPFLGMISLLEGRGHSGYGRLAAQLSSQIPLQAGDKVLEVGCGSGFLARALAQRANSRLQIVATDINRYLLTEAAVLANKERLDRTISFAEANAEALPFPEAKFDAALSCTVLEEGDADRMLSELARVTKPGGRVAVMARAVDMNWWVNLPLPVELQSKLNALGPSTGAGAGEAGCADSSLYQRLNRAGLIPVAVGPQFAVYAEGERLRDVLNRLISALTPEQQQACRNAVTEAESEGTLFVAEPFHCAIGEKPISGSRL